MFIVITGLDGSGTSSIGNALHEIDKESFLFHTPGKEYSQRDEIDISIRKCSQQAHYLYYLSSVVYMSDYIRKNIDYEKNNVYCVRYLIDTVVSHRVAGLDLSMEDIMKQNHILKPDLTIFVTVQEKIRQERITIRGKSILDEALDNKKTRENFLKEFETILTDKIIIDTSLNNLPVIAKDFYEKYLKRSI